jgi:hypothetical protein
LGKAPDLLLRVNAVQHHTFLTVLNEHGIAFNGNEVKIAHNTLVGIEIECASEPNSSLTRSIANNLTKDRAVGLMTIIFAVLPNGIECATQYLRDTNDNLDGIYVIDALRLLDELRKEPLYA